MNEVKILSTYIDSRGYVIGRGIGTHKKIRMHRYVMEQHIGRPLLPTEDVHHKDGDKTNNSIENLEVLEHGKHSSLSSNMREHANGYRCNLLTAERERRRDWGRTVLAEANRKRFEAKRLGKPMPKPTEAQLKNRFYARRWRANRKAALAAANGESEEAIGEVDHRFLNLLNKHGIQSA